METLETVQAGDLVVYYSRNSEYPHLRTVQRTTKTRIIIESKHTDNFAFRRSDGKEIDAGQWYWARIEPVTPQQVAELQERDKRDNLIAAIEKTPFSKLSTERLEAILALATKEETNEETRS